VGNALEMIEAIELLRGNAPKDYYEHCLHVAAHVLVLGQRAKDLEEGRALAEKSITDGSALEKFRVLVRAQGGDVSYVDDISKFERAKYVEVVKAPRSGYISQVHARLVGEASVALGAGRAKKGDPIDRAVGFRIFKKVGEKVEKGEPLFEIHANNEEKLAESRQAVLSAYNFNDEFVPPLPLFYE
jgi:pyrimidine-nucleoside phosphorylase